jgi:hypothetical protein
VPKVFQSIADSTRRRLVLLRIRINPQTRVILCVSGAVIAFVGASINGFYIIEYPPDGTVGTGRLAHVIGSFNAWDGPVDGSRILYGIGAAVLVAVITFFTAEGGGTIARRYVPSVARRLARYASPTIVVTYLWQFRVPHVPIGATNAFVNASGNTASSVLRSRRLMAGFGAGQLLLFIIGVFIYSIGLFSADSRENVIAQLERRIHDLKASLYVRKR